MVANYRLVGDRFSDRGGDDGVFLPAAVALGCGVVASAASLFGCANKVFQVFEPSLSWLMLAPGVLAMMLGSAGLCAAKRPASNLLRLQLAVFILVDAALLIGAGAFVFEKTGTTAQLILDGCDGYHATGLWSQAGGIEKEMRMVSEQYNQLMCGFERCRAINPLVYDLSMCGVRAVCAGHGLSSQVPLYGWHQHVQSTFFCGGFCEDDVPLFGAAGMRETLSTRPACADKAAASIQSMGRILGGVVALVALPMVCGAFALFCLAGTDDESEFVDQHSDYDDEMSALDPGSSRG